LPARARQRAHRRQDGTKQRKRAAKGVADWAREPDLFRASLKGVARQPDSQHFCFSGRGPRKAGEQKDLQAARFVDVWGREAKLGRKVDLFRSPFSVPGIAYLPTIPLPPYRRNVCLSVHFWCRDTTWGRPLVSEGGRSEAKTKKRGRSKATATKKGRRHSRTRKRCVHTGGARCVTAGTDRAAFEGAWWLFAGAFKGRQSDEKSARVVPTVSMQPPSLCQTNTVD